MSDAIFPSLPGLTWNREKNPEFRNLIQTSANGKDKAAAFWSYPKWHFKLGYEFLRDDGTAKGELQQLVGFFLARQGNFDTFLYRDPDDNQATNQVIGIGDGGTREFQLVRNYAGFIEPVFGIVAKPNITVGGAIVPFSYTSKGLIIFNTAPSQGAQIVGNFDFFYRVRFKESMGQFNNFLHKLWEAKTVEFASVK